MAIVAVFLALAIGILAGSAFVEPELVRQLQSRTDDLLKRTRDLEQDLTETRAEVGALDAFAEATLPHLARNILLGHTAVVVAQDGVEDAVLAESMQALTVGGARVVATISAEDKLVSEDPAVQGELATILGAAGTGPVDPSEVAGILASRLTTQPATSDPEDDVLDGLLSAGFLAPAPAGPGVSQASLGDIGAPGQVILVLAGGAESEVLIDPADFAVPLVLALDDLGAPVAAGESLLTELPFVALVRDDDDAGIVTVDDLDLDAGGAALALGLEERLRTGDGGAYGVKDGADPLPPLP